MICIMLFMILRFFLATPARSEQLNGSLCLYSRTMARSDCKFQQKAVLETDCDNSNPNSSNFGRKLCVADENDCGPHQKRYKKQKDERKDSNLLYYISFFGTKIEFVAEQDSDFAKDQKKINFEANKSRDISHLRFNVLKNQTYFLLILLSTSQSEFQDIYNIISDEIPRDEETENFKLSYLEEPIINFEYSYLTLCLSIDNYNHHLYCLKKLIEKHIVASNDTKTKEYYQHLFHFNEIDAISYIKIQEFVNSEKASFSSFGLSDSQAKSYYEKIYSMSTKIEHNCDFLRSHIEAIIKTENSGVRYSGYEICQNPISDAENYITILNDNKTSNKILKNLKYYIKIIIDRTNLILKNLDVLEYSRSSTNNTQPTGKTPININIHRTNKSEENHAENTTTLKNISHDRNPNPNAEPFSTDGSTHMKNESKNHHTSESRGFKDEEIKGHFYSSFESEYNQELLKESRISHSKKSYCNPSLNIERSANDRIGAVNFETMEIGSLDKEHTVFILLSSNYEIRKSNYHKEYNFFIEMIVIMKKYLASLKVKDSAKENSLKDFYPPNVEARRDMFYKLLMIPCNNFQEPEQEMKYFGSLFRKSELELPRYKKYCEFYLPEIKCIIRFLYIYIQSELEKRKRDCHQKYHALIDVLITCNTFNLLKFHLYLIVIMKSVILDKEHEKIVEYNCMIENLVTKIRKELLNCGNNFDYRFKNHAYNIIVKIFGNNEHIKNLREKNNNLQVFFDNLFKELFLEGFSKTKILTSFYSKIQEKDTKSKKDVTNSRHKTDEKINVGSSIKDEEFCIGPDGGLEKYLCEKIYSDFKPDGSAAFKEPFPKP